MADCLRLRSTRTLRLVVLVDLELEPCATARDDLRAEDFLIGGAVLLTVEVHARGTHELGDDRLARCRR